MERFDCKPPDSKRKLRERKKYPRKCDSSSQGRRDCTSSCGSGRDQELNGVAESPLLPQCKPCFDFTTFKDISDVRAMGSSAGRSFNRDNGRLFSSGRMN